MVERSQAPKADLRARIAAGLSLGFLGDPRFQRSHEPDGDYLLPPMIKIPGGTYTVGSDEGLYDDEAPLHKVTLEPFNLAQYPVTNAEWRVFMNVRGYDDTRWWPTSEAETWRSGESTTEGPKQQSRKDRKYFQENFDSIRNWVDQNKITTKQADDWEQIAQMSDSEFEDLLIDWYPPGRQTQLERWNDFATIEITLPMLTTYISTQSSMAGLVALMNGRIPQFTAFLTMKFIQKIGPATKKTNLKPANAAVDAFDIK